MDGTIAGEVLTTITGMAGAAKAVAETVKLLRAKVKGNQEAERAISEALDQVLSLRSGMLDLQEKALSLQQELSRAQSENIKLREEIRHEKERTADRQHFQRKKMGEAVVMIRDDEPGIFYCPSCFETRKQAIPIQAHPSRTGTFGTHFCSTCETNFRLPHG